MFFGSFTVSFESLAAAGSHGACGGKGSTAVHQAVMFTYFSSCSIQKKHSNNSGSNGGAVSSFIFLCFLSPQDTSATQLHIIILVLSKQRYGYCYSVHAVLLMLLLVRRGVRGSGQGGFTDVHYCSSSTHHVCAL